MVLKGKQYAQSLSRPFLKDLCREAADSQISKIESEKKDDEHN